MGREYSTELHTTTTKRSMIPLALFWCFESKRLSNIATLGLMHATCIREESLHIFGFVTRKTQETMLCNLCCRLEGGRCCQILHHSPPTYAEESLDEVMRERAWCRGGVRIQMRSHSCLRRLVWDGFWNESTLDDRSTNATHAGEIRSAGRYICIVFRASVIVFWLCCLMDFALTYSCVFEWIF
jgi:hypothetical protein